MSNLIINEIFYSIQGETSRSGLPTYFVRLTGCPLRCSYCDTEYAFQNGKKMTFNEIISILDIRSSRFVTITGGEPLAQKNVLVFMKNLCDLGYSVSIETSNCLSIEGIDSRVSIILDVKTPGSKEEDKNLYTNYQKLKSSDEIKFVICNPDDFEWAVEYINKYNLNKYCPILFSPSYGEMPLKELADLILDNSLQVRLQTQLHKTIWGNINGK
jgi:7-carboxy-7-deazaguanine synthase